MNTYHKRVALALCALLSVFAQSADAADHVVFEDYQIQVNTDSKKASSQRVRLPKKETDAFLSMISNAAEQLDKCEEYQQSEINPLIRRSIGIKIAPDRFGCRVEIAEYGVHVYSCMFSSSQAQTLSSYWRTAAHGPALGARSPEELALLTEKCEIQ